MKNLNKKNFLLKVWLKQLSFVFLLLFLLSCSKDSEPTPAPTTLPTPALPPTEATTPISASSLIEAMGTGFNLGNTFDVSQQNTNPTSIYPIIDLYASAGMKHIRIPVTWMGEFSGNTLANANGEVNFSHARFVQLKAVIDYAMKKGLYVVLNTHHENWLYKNYDGTAPYNNKFTNLWTGIATYFKNYSQLLIFEVLNEPQGVFGDWNGGASVSNSTALALTRQINKVGYDAIRQVGGSNSFRIIMVQPNGMGNQSQLKVVYTSNVSLPGGGSDQYLSFQVHTYDPWAFCGQTGTNSSYPGSTSIANSLKAVSTYAKSLNVPVNYGEFGVGRSSNAAERDSDIVREYYRIIRATCTSEKMSPTVWDDRGWFGLINSGGTSFLYNIVPNMMAP